jgi:hypothetical protein
MFRVLVIFWIIGAIAFVLVHILPKPEYPHTSLLTYQELVDYPSDCDRKRYQLNELLQTKQFKNFDTDPDKLTETQRAYNSVLNDKIWWYDYNCQK